MASKNNETFKEREKLLYCPETLSLITINNHLKEDDIQFIEQYYTYNQNTHKYERNDNLSSSDLEKLSNFFKLKIYKDNFMDKIQENTKIEKAILAEKQQIFLIQNKLSEIEKNIKE